MPDGSQLEMCAASDAVLHPCAGWQSSPSAGGNIRHTMHRQQEQISFCLCRVAVWQHEPTSCQPLQDLLYFML